MDRFEISTLRDYYGALLTERQNEMLRMRYDEDLSFGEIAEICGVSRQAVLDGINKGERHLAEYEQALGLVSKHRRVGELLDCIESEACNIKANEIVDALAKIRRISEE